MNKIMLLIVTLALPQNASCSIVEIFNTTPMKIEASLDIVAYPDPKKTIGMLSSTKEDIGLLLLRGISVNMHIGDHFMENVLSEYLPQTFGLGDITYYVFSEVKNLGRVYLADEYTLEYTFYLIRCPKFLYPGGVVSKSVPITMRTRNFETFYNCSMDSAYEQMETDVAYASSYVR